MKIVKLLKNQYFWLSVIIVIGFWVRLYKIESPIADWHSWRQADTAAVTRNFIKYGFNPLLPKYDDMSGVSEKPLVNPNTYRFVEFPIYNIAVYPFYLLFGSLDQYSRLVSVLFSLGSIVFLYLICKRYLGIFVSLLTAFIYALLPFNVFFSRTTLPEPTFLFFALGMIYFLETKIWKDKGIWSGWGFIFMAIAFLIKPWAIFFFLPLLYSAFVNGFFTKEKRKLLFEFVIFSLISLLPFILWRLWILQQPQGIPASGWLMNSDGIRFRPAYWWWLISQRLGGEILGVSGLTLFIIGLLTKPVKNYFFHIWLLSMFFYFIVFATGNIRHNYYQYIFVPVAAVFLTLGFVRLILGVKDFLPRIFTIVMAFFLLPLAFYFSYHQVKGFYQINNPVIIEVGRKADMILPREAIVVAPYNGDTAFLYQTNRRGWPVVALPLTELVADYGVTHFISTAKDVKTSWVLRHFQVLEENPGFIIADMTKITKPIEGDQEP